MMKRGVVVAMVLASGLFAGKALAEVILTTDFNARTVSGNTAQNIAWTTNGIANPGDMTAVDVNSTGALAGLYDTANAAGHFAPNLNVGNEGPWRVDIPIDIGVGYSAASITNVSLDWQHFNNSGNFQASSYSVDWTVTLKNASSAVLGAATNLNVSGNNGITVLSFAAAIDLSSSETYTLEVRAEGTTTTGNNTGLDVLTINGTSASGPPNASVVTVK